MERFLKVLNTPCSICRIQGITWRLLTGRLQADAMRFAKMAKTPNFVADGGYSITENYEVQWMQGMDRDRCVQYLKYLTSHNVP